MSLTLYSYFRSSTSYRVRIALNWKELDYTIVPINLLQGKQRDAEYAYINPAKGIPTLIDGQQAMTQSLAIMEYLEETYPEPALLPAGATARAQARAISQLIGCDIHPVNNLRILQYITGPLGHSEADKLAWIQHWTTEGFTALEIILKECAGTYCYGDNVTMADMCLAPQMFNAERFGCDLSPYPTLLRIHNTCRSLPAFEKAHPDNQPDTP